MSKKFKFMRSFGRKGYYIALILCAAAIGISGYLYYKTATTPSNPQLSDPQPTLTPGGDMQVDGTLPGGEGTQNHPEDNKDPAKKPMPIGKPVSGETIHGYAMDCLSYNETTRDWRVHNGIDIAAEAGTTVCAAAPGTVYTVYKDDTMGHTVVIRHQDGYVTKYSSLDADIPVSAGDTVSMGTAIGKVANTALLENAIGDHLHFSVTHNDEPMDPAEFFELS